jgi:hypothetical protein
VLGRSRRGALHRDIGIRRLITPPAEAVDVGIDRPRQSFGGSLMCHRQAATPKVNQLQSFRGGYLALKRYDTPC